MTDAGVTADLARALAATEAVVAGIRPDQWAAPTSCTGLRGPFGTAPGAVLVHVRIAEVLTHGHRSRLLAA